MISPFAPFQKKRKKTLDKRTGWMYSVFAGWESLVIRWIHTPENADSNSAPATRFSDAFRGVAVLHISQLRCVGESSSVPYPAVRSPWPRIAGRIYRRPYRRSVQAGWG